MPLDKVLDQPAFQPQAAEPPRRSAALRRIKWVIIGVVAFIEILFDFVIEPWLRATPFEENAERFIGLGETLAIVSVIWVVFQHIQRLERSLAERQAQQASLYEAARQWDGQLEALHAASVAMGREGTYPQVLGRIAALAAQLSRAKYCALAELDEQQNVVEFVTYGVPEEAREAIGKLPTHRGLLARLSGTTSLRIDDVTDDPAFSGFPQGHPTFRAFLGVPIRWEGELLGHLYLGGHEGEVPFDQPEERLLEMFAMQSAVAIARERIARKYAHDVRDSERRQIAMELHDRALQGLYALGIQLERARRRGLRALTDTMSVDLAIEAVQRSMQAIRGILDAIERGAQDGPTPAIFGAAEQVARLYGMQVRWQGREIVACIPDALVSDLAMSIQEAASNAARHGQATMVQVELDRRDGALCLAIRDNGRGFDPQAVPHGHGLSTLHQRISDLGGRVTLSRSPSGGAVLDICIPLPPGA